jgi:hypothetical protein
MPKTYVLLPEDTICENAIHQTYTLLASGHYLQ